MVEGLVLCCPASGRFLRHCAREFAVRPELRFFEHTRAHGEPWRIRVRFRGAVMLVNRERAAY